MSRAHLTPTDQADYALASDLGRKAGLDAVDAVHRVMLLGESAYQREVIVLAAAVSVVTAAAVALRCGSAPNATSKDVIEALVEMLPSREDFAQ